MEKIFRKSAYQMIARKIFNYLSFSDINNTRWLQTTYIKNMTKSFNYEDAILDNNYANVEYLTYHILFKSNDTTLDHIMSYAAKFGNRMIMELLYANGCWLSADTFQCLAKIGNLDDMKWLKNIGGRLDTWTFCAAITNGNLENMKWLMEVGCPISKDLIATAIYTGNLETIQWLLDNGFPYEKDIIYEAQIYAKPNVIAWLKENLA